MPKSRGLTIKLNFEFPDQIDDSDIDSMLDELKNELESTMSNVVGGIGSEGIKVNHTVTEDGNE